jgi:hypothetical protein
VAEIATQAAHYIVLQATTASVAQVTKLIGKTIRAVVGSVGAILSQLIGADRPGYVTVSDIGSWVAFSDASASVGFSDASAQVLFSDTASSMTPSDAAPSVTLSDN